MCCIHFDAINLGSNLPFGELFLPFQISYRIKIEIIKKMNKVLVRVGVGRALLSQCVLCGIRLIILIKMYTSYFYILFYNVQH